MDDINHNIDLVGMAQPSPTTCWLASYKMLLKAAGKPHSDDSIRAKFKLFNIDFDDALANGLDGKDWATAAFALGFAPMIPLQYKLDGGAFDRAFGRTSGQKAFLAVLAKAPLWIGRKVGAGTSHAIIARGFSSWENKVIWVNPENKANKNAFENRSTLENFIAMIATPMGAVQFCAG
jgi:hypothetical protein